MARNRRTSPITLSVFLLAGLVLIGAPSFAQETPTQAEPQAAAQQQAPAEPAAPQQAQAQRIFRDASKIIVDGKAEANGVLAFTFEPHGAEATLVRVNVLAKAKPKDIAQDLAKQLEFTVGPNYKVKANNEKVEVSLKNKKAPVFFLGIEEQSVSGVAVRITKG
jgi:hypothetical protein